MKQSFSRPNIWILKSDLEAIHSALLRAGYSEDRAMLFSGINLKLKFEEWEIFVNTDWSIWDLSEYNHDIGCRYWIQTAIENSCNETKMRLEGEVKLVDALYIAKMRLLRSPDISREHLPISGHPYFWEIGTIHPKDHRN